MPEATVRRTSCSRQGAISARPSSAALALLKPLTGVLPVVVKT
jgi:hypothetical protein